MKLVSYIMSVEASFGDDVGMVLSYSDGHDNIDLGSDVVM